jgi:hypothetical protein
MEKSSGLPFYPVNNSPHFPALTPFTWQSWRGRRRGVWHEYFTAFSFHLIPANAGIQSGGGDQGKE